jgi:hypothetical protein
MPAKTSPISKVLRRQITGRGDHPVDLMPIYEASGRPRGKSPIMWARRTGIDPGISVEGDGPTGKVLGDRALARDYAHTLDESIPRGYLHTTDLEAKGWTRSMIERFLPEPDATAPNPHYRKAAEMRLFRAERVAKVERSRSFRAVMEGSGKRKEAARRATETKTEALSSEIEELEIEVQVLDRDEVTRRAILEFEEHTGGAVPDQIDRLIVNYIRHHLTRYDRTLFEIRGRVGQDEAYLAISRKVFVAIEEEYPWLAEECRRQMEERQA